LTGAVQNPLVPDHIGDAGKSEAGWIRGPLTPALSLKGEVGGERLEREDAETLLALL